MYCGILLSFLFYVEITLTSSSTIGNQQKFRSEIEDNEGSLSLSSHQKNRNGMVTAMNTSPNANINGDRDNMTYLLAALPRTTSGSVPLNQMNYGKYLSSHTSHKPNRRKIYNNINNNNQQYFNYNGLTVGGNSGVAYTEILRFLEAFLRLKGELIGQFWSLINDNWHIIIAVSNTIMSKLGTIHQFTINFLNILSKIMEYTSRLLK